jgi:hypothetical protein
VSRRGAWGGAAAIADMGRLAVRLLGARLQVEAELLLGWGGGMRRLGGGVYKGRECA